MSKLQETSVKDQADAECLAILPGLMCNSMMFAGQLAKFPGAIVIDGFYGGARRIAEMARYVLDRLPARFNLMGHSMGARVALEVFRIAPERVRRLALVDTGIHPVQQGEAEKRFALRDLGREEGIEALVDRWLPPMLGDAALADLQLVDRLHTMSVEAGLDTYEAQIDALLHRPSVDDLLGTITCPTFAIVGAQDHWSPPAQHRAIVKAISGAQLRIVEGAGHMLPAERVEAFNAVVQEWLAFPGLIQSKAVDVDPQVSDGSQ